MLSHMGPGRRLLVAQWVVYIGVLAIANNNTDYLPQNTSVCFRSNFRYDLCIPGIEYMWWECLIMRMDVEILRSRGCIQCNKQSQTWST